MRLLLDTHALLWFIEGDLNLSQKVKGLIENTENEVYVSMASLFEISIKLKLDKLFLKKPLEDTFQDILDAYIVILPMRNSHLIQYQNIPVHPEHRDPFDRLIIATAIAEKAEIISKDSKFQNYKELITVVW